MSLATIDSIPNELFTEIFQYLFASFSVQAWYQHILPDLRLVSRRWNSIIERSSSLWTSLLVTEKSVHPPSADDLPTYYSSTFLRLERSWNLPLHVTIDLSILPDPDVFGETEAGNLGIIIAKEARRIVSFHLRAKSRKLSVSLLKCLKITLMPKLRSYTHIGCEDPELGGADTFIPFIEEGTYFDLTGAVLQRRGPLVDRNELNAWGKEHYPVLEDIEISGVLFQCKRLPMMNTVRRLCIRAQPRNNRPSSTTLSDILRSARKSLEVLELEDVVRRGNVFAPVVLDKLRIFSLGYDDPKQVVNFLLSVRMPALTDLTLTYTSANRASFDAASPGHQRLLHALIQHFPLDQIKRLSLNGVVFSNGKRSQITIPRSEDGLTAQERLYYTQELQLKKFAPVFGHWKMPLFVLFLFKCATLEHLTLDDVRSENKEEDPKRVIGSFWKNGALSTLETCDIDGSADGLFLFLLSVEEDRIVGNRSQSLEVSVGEKLKDALSEGEMNQLELYYAQTSCSSSDLLTW